MIVKVIPMKFLKFRSSSPQVPAAAAPCADGAASSASAAASDGGGEAAGAPRYRFPSWLDFLALVGLFVVVQLAVTLVVLLAGSGMPAAGSDGTAEAEAAQEAAARINFCAYPFIMGAMIVLTLLYRRLRGGNRRLGRYASRGLNPVLILWGFVLMTAAGVVIEPLVSLLPAPPDVYGRGWQALLLTVVMAPLAEEFLCRGILLDAARAKGGAAYGLLFSSLFFGVIHFYPAAVVNATVLGLVLGFIYIRSNSLYITVILHAFNNALALLLLTLGYGDTTLRRLLADAGREWLYAPLYGVALGIFFAAGCMVWKTLARLRRQERQAAGTQ